MKKNMVSALSTFNLLLFLSMKSIWSGIEWMLGVSWLQFFFLGLFVLMFLTAIVHRFHPMKPVGVSILIGVNGVFTIALGYMAYMGIDSYYFFVRSFFEVTFIFLLGISAYLLIFNYPKCSLSHNRAYQWGLLGLTLLTLFVFSTNLDVHYMTQKPVVYVVEESYQIVWTTSTHATAKVIVDGEEYIDLYAGSALSETTVHKVMVPMAVLNQAKTYTVSSTHIFYRGPYSGIKGGTLEKTFAFQPVDSSDGLNYYTVSDTHTQNRGAINAVRYHRERLDFLILAGDIMNHLETKEDCERILSLGHQLTQGEIPVIFARGNHEVKGTYAHELHRYVGSLNERFYFTFHLDDIFGVVLDLGEDHADDWWEFYGTAYFDQYHSEQTTFLQTVYEEEAYLDPTITYRLGICHIPVTLVEDEFLDTTLNEWTPFLNAMNLDAMISGHKHQLLAFTTEIPALIPFDYHQNYASEPMAAGYRTNATFVNMIAARRSDVQSIEQKENLFGFEYTGLLAEVSFSDSQTTFTYTNHKGEIVEVVDPYSGETRMHYIIPID